jgi:hypothetical protein
LLIVLFEEAVDRGLQVGDGPEDAALEPALCEGREEALDCIKPTPMSGKQSAILHATPVNKFSICQSSANNLLGKRFALLDLISESRVGSA